MFFITDTLIVCEMKINFFALGYDRNLKGTLKLN